MRTVADLLAVRATGRGCVEFERRSKPMLRSVAVARGVLQQLSRAAGSAGLMRTSLPRGVSVILCSAKAMLMVQDGSHSWSCGHPARQTAQPCRLHVILHRLYNLKPAEYLMLGCAAVFPSPADPLSAQPRHDAAN